MISAAEAEALLGASIPAVMAKARGGERLSYHEKLWLRVWLRTHTAPEVLELCEVTCEVRCADGSRETVWESRGFMEPARARVDELILRRAASCAR